MAHECDILQQCSCGAPAQGGRRAEAGRASCQRSAPAHMLPLARHAARTSGEHRRALPVIGFIWHMPCTMRNELGDGHEVLPEVHNLQHLRMNDICNIKGKQGTKDERKLIPLRASLQRKLSSACSLSSGRTIHAIDKDACTARLIVAGRRPAGWLLVSRRAVAVQH